MMKLDLVPLGSGAVHADPKLDRYCVWNETDRLTDVLLCRPNFLAPVPCCSVTRESLREGFTTSTPLALAQHRALEAVLERAGVRCHFIDPVATLPDMCFTRDVLVMTPWGLLALNPAAEHRRAEVGHAVNALRTFGAPLAARVRKGSAEGGDIVIVRQGLAIIGCSGERTDEAGANSVAGFFHGHGWEVIVYRFDPHFLHLDTLFTMVGDGIALACTEALSNDLLIDISARGIETIAVSYKEARLLSCNVLSLGDRHILTSTNGGRVTDALRARGFHVETLALDQFTRCGGGVHCLTMPLARTGGRRPSRPAASRGR